MSIIDDAGTQITDKGLMELVRRLEPFFLGRTQRGGGGTGPIGPIDSTENVGDTWGVHSEDPGTGHEPENYVLTADGLGGSIWAPSIGVFQTFPDAVAAIAATKTLLGYWRFGEAAAPWADTSGYAGGPRDATESGSGTAVTSDVTGALPSPQDDGAVELFQGKHPKAAEVGSPIFNLSGADLSVAAWVKPQQAVTGIVNSSIGTYVATAWPGNGGWGLSFEQGSAYTSVPCSFIRHDGSNPASAVTLNGPRLVLDEWVFIVGTYSTTGGYRLYVNGVLYAQSATTTPVSLPTFNAGVFFGQNGTIFTGGGQGVFTGMIDEVSVWGSTLTAAEVATLAASGGIATSVTTNVVVTATAYTASQTDDVILVSGTTTVTLPDAVGISGHRITVRNTGTNTVTVARSLSQTIDGVAADQTLAAADSLTVVSDGSNWQIISRIRALVDGGSP